MKKHVTDFFIVGAPKAGTTSLYHYLDQHPGICMSKIKEPNYFSATELKAARLYYSEPVIDREEGYDSLFNECDRNALRGEASVSYLYYPGVPSRIKAYNPSAKIIILLRDPSSRAFSHWLMDERLGYVNQTLDHILNSGNSTDNYYSQYIELGMYASQVERYFHSFGKENVLIFLQEDLRNDSAFVMERLYTFLNVEPIQIADDHHEHNAARKINSPLLSVLYQSRNMRRMIKFVLPQRVTSRMLNGISSADERRASPQLLLRLGNIYRNDISRLERLINRDLSAWNQ